MLLPQEYRQLLTRLAEDLDRSSLAEVTEQPIIDQNYLQSLDVPDMTTASELYDVIATCIAAYLSVPEEMQFALWTTALFWLDPERRDSPGFSSAMYWSTWRPALLILQDRYEPPGTDHPRCSN